MFALNVFQRLMTSAPGDDVLKPDAARDCVFIESPTIYTCTLQKDLTFAGGDPLTSSDVKFSIERALRLDVPGSSTSLLSSLRRIDTPDDLTVRFLLSRVDTQFGWALASPAASIVDEQVYDADEVRSPKDPAVGSGPFVVTSDDDSGASRSIVFNRFPDYNGFTPAADRRAHLPRRSPDSATIEDAMEKGAGRRRLARPEHRGRHPAVASRSAAARTEDDGQRLQRDGCSAAPGCASCSGRRARRPGRTRRCARRSPSPCRATGRSDSIVPNGIPGHVATFPQGGKAKPQGDLEEPDQPDARLRPDRAERRRPRRPASATGSRTPAGSASGSRPGGRRRRPRARRPQGLDLDGAGLAPALRRRPAARVRADAVDATTNAYRASTDDATLRCGCSPTLQRQAATDLVLLPISQSDETVWVRAGADVDDGSYGPGWQLGLFGISA